MGERAEDKVSLVCFGREHHTKRYLLKIGILHILVFKTALLLRFCFCHTVGGGGGGSDISL